MDTILSVDAYNDFPCGTPTNPNGEQRYCCRQCPSSKKDLALQPRWASNPKLMLHLTDDEKREVLARAMALGPLQVDIRVAIPPPVPNAAVDVGSRDSGPVFGNNNQIPIS